MNRLQQEYDAYAIEEPSDEERGSSSSEDELDVLLHGTPEQKRKLIRECLTGESESSSEDEFEKEMEKELSSTMKSMEGKWQNKDAATSAAAASAGGDQQQFYDEVYFDSDSEEEVDQNGKKQNRKQKHKVLSNDDLLYDPHEDDRDQEWVDAKRRSYRNIRKQRKSLTHPNKRNTLPSSDAILNCPACMTTLCLDCQRHESYRTQYRAMFVMNCTVNKEEVLKLPEQPIKNRRRERKKMKAPSADSAMETQSPDVETFHPVKCNECSTEVAVYDKEEVYHFFNVLASHS
ncbi:E2F-associated phosphoprotein isoform X2 [Bufo bufo]|uniref:E2F-associated phosphoprotein isoform X2 n=1 Tax=Bufo bufo TaxID=8384 RepID=UPI001ABE5045|nr:E2F-associated phosphoprotein isoform X2 [Bufo bufo]